MKRYYSEGEVRNCDDGKCDKEETDLTYIIFSNIYYLSYFPVTTL
jgi:hypothetical protein